MVNTVHISDTPTTITLETYEKTPLMQCVSYYFQLEGLVSSILTKAEYSAFLKIVGVISNEGIEYIKRSENVSN